MALVNHKKSMIHVLNPPTIIKILLKNQLLKKTIKGYLAAYLYVIIPKIFSISKCAIKRKESLDDTIQKIIEVIRKSALPNRFPALVAKLIALSPLFESWLRKTGVKQSTSRFISASVSSFFLFRQHQKRVLNHYQHPGTLGITSFVSVRAGDVIVRSLAKNASPRLSAVGDVTFFSAASAIVMYCWFYYPERLSKSYSNWITMAANMDDELVLGLRGLHNGDIVYGEYTKYDDLLVNVAKKYNLDPETARFSKVELIPCRLLHSGVSDNCEVHALWRFQRGMTTALSIYLPLNILFNISGSRPVKQKLIRILRGSLRSSAFLASFIVLCWYGVCFERSRLGPLLYPNTNKSFLDKKYGVALGCAWCGLSSLVEKPRRRGELALFVAPKALKAIIPRTFDSRFASIEAVVFAISFGILVSQPQNVRGFVGQLGRQVF